MDTVIIRRLTSDSILVDVRMFEKIGFKVVKQLEVTEENGMTVYKVVMQREG